MKKKPKYIYPLNYLEDGFQKTKLGIEDLVNASNILLEKKLYAPSLSISVIALEECGKIVILDSLLYLHKKEENYYKKSSISHTDKLNAVGFLSSFLLLIAEHDPQSKKDSRYLGAVTIVARHLHAEYKTTRDLYLGENFGILNKLKQKGLYSDFSENKFKNPALSIDEKISVQVNKLANRFARDIKDIMNKNAIDGYLSNAKKIRGKMLQEDWEKISDLLKVPKYEN